MQPNRSIPSALALAALALGACGQDRERSRTAAEPAPSRTLVAALGDSITAGSPRWDPDPRVRATIGPGVDPRSRYEYWARLRLGLGVSFRNCGVFGERTDEIAGRFDSCTSGARAVVIQGGINDIAQGRSVDAAARNLDSMVARAEERGLTVAIVTVLPWNNGYPQAARPIAELNEGIEAIGRRRDVPVLPFHRALEDPRRPGRMRTSMTDDGDHPSIAGYRRLGALVTRRALGLSRR